MLNVFSVLAALLSCGDLARHSGVVSEDWPAVEPSVSTIYFSNSLTDATLTEKIRSPFRFGERWLYTLHVELVQLSSQCLLVFEGPANFHCRVVNDTHAEIIFLPVAVGNLSAKLVLPEREVHLEGVGLPNPFCPAGLEFTLPPNVTFEPWLYLHNPFSTPVRLKEVYATNSMFSIDVPVGTSWTIPAHTTRPVARLSINHEKRHDISLLRVRSVHDEVSLFIPLRFLPADVVTESTGLFSPERNLDFGPLFVTSSPRTVPLNIVNTSPKSVVLQGSGDSEGLRLVSPEKPVGPGKTCTVKVTVDPQRLTRTSGKLLLRGGKLKLQVPYTLQLLNGSLQAANSRFYIGAKGKRAFSVEVKNEVNSGLHIERILLDSKRVDPPAEPVVAKNQTVEIVLPTPPNSSNSFNSTMRVLTNVTEFVYKLEFYSGKLELRIDNKLVTDRVDIGTLGLKQKKKLALEFYNANPLEMRVEYVASNLSSGVIAMPSPPPWMLVPYGSLQVKLTVKSLVEGPVWGDIAVKTDYEKQSWVFGFQASKGTVTAAGMSNSRMISVEGAFPYRNSAELVYLESTFDEPLFVLKARVSDERFSMVLVDSPVLHPGAKSLLGTLIYRPVCTQCYVGLGGPLESSATKDLFLWREMQERLKEAKAVNATLSVDTKQIKGFVVPVTVSHVWPRVTARGAVRFETIRLGNVSYNPVIVDNPSDQPLMIQAYISTVGGPEINAIVGAQHSMKLPPHLSTAFSIDRSIQYSLSVIPPKSKKRILVRFEPTTVGTHIGVLVVRNNLTAVSSVILKGDGGVGKILLAGQEPGGTIVFDINASLLKDCGNIGVYSTLKKYPVAKNVGHLPIRVRKVLINNYPCIGYGFRVKECGLEESGFTIKPNASHRIEMSFTPDFSVSRVKVILSLVLDDSVLDFNLVVILPESSVPPCAEQMARPTWETLFCAFCFLGAVLLILCTVGYAFLDSNRVLRDTLYNPPANRERGEIMLIENVSAFLEKQRLEQRASVATQTATEETGPERKPSTHEKPRGASSAGRRKDSSSSSSKKDVRRRRKDVVDGDRQSGNLFDETHSEFGEENDLDEASEPEEREESSSSFVGEANSNSTKEETFIDDDSKLDETASEDSLEVLPHKAEKVKTKNQRKNEKRERQRKQLAVAKEPLVCEDNQKKSYAEVAGNSQLERRNPRKTPEDCTNRVKKQQKQTSKSSSPSASSNGVPAPTEVNRSTAQVHPEVSEEVPKSGVKNISKNTHSNLSFATAVANDARATVTNGSSVGSSPTGKTNSAVSRTPATLNSTLQSAFSWSNFGSSNSAGETGKPMTVAFPMAWTKPIYSFSNAVLSSAASRVTTSLTLSSDVVRSTPAQESSSSSSLTRGSLGVAASSTVSSAQASDVESDSPRPDEEEEYEEEETMKLDDKLYPDEENALFGVLNTVEATSSNILEHPRNTSVLEELSRSNLLGRYVTESSEISKIENSNMANAETSDLSRSNSSAGHSSNISCCSIASSSSPSSELIVIQGEQNSAAFNSENSNNFNGLENSLCNSINSILNNLNNTTNNKNSDKNLNSDARNFGANGSAVPNSAVAGKRATRPAAVNILTELKSKKHNKKSNNNNHNIIDNNNTNIDNKQLQQQPSKLGVISDICNSTAPNKLGNINESCGSSSAGASYSAVVSGINNSSENKSKNNKNSGHKSNNNNKNVETVKHPAGAARRGNPPPGFGLRPTGVPNYVGSFETTMSSERMGFGRSCLQSSVGGSSLSSSGTSSSSATPTISSSGSKCGTEQNEEQEMAPLIRSIIDSVIPSSDRDDRSSVHWASPGGSNSNASPQSCQVWGAENSWMNAPGTSGAPPSQMYPTFLRRTPERESELDKCELGLDLHQRMAWNQAQQSPPRLQQVPHHLHPGLNPPAMSPTNDYSYTGTDIWTTTQSGSTEPPMFPSPIGTPWTPFRSPSLPLPPFKGSYDRVVKKKNQ